MRATATLFLSLVFGYACFLAGKYSRDAEVQSGNHELRELRQELLEAKWQYHAIQARDIEKSLGLE